MAINQSKTEHDIVWVGGKKGLRIYWKNWVNRDSDGKRQIVIV